MTPPLAHDLVTHPGATPTRWIFFLHGILGTGANWRSLARRVVSARPHWGAVLVDLREHGGSLGRPPPHDIAATVGDLRALAPHVPGPIGGVLGHSFGGKVALAYAGHVDTDTKAMETIILVDSNPGARPKGRGSESTLDVIDALRGLPRVFPSRKEFVAAVQAAGQPPAIAQWLAMNLVAEGDGVRFGPDLDVIDTLLDDYFRLDAWPIVESAPAPLAIITGSKSTVFTEEDRARIAQIVASSGGRVVGHDIPDAGHWVHVDAPERTLAWILEALPT
jgi:esterase